MKKTKQPSPKQQGLTLYLELARQCPCKTASQKHVLLYYASRVDKYGRCHPSRETVIRETQLSKDTITVANNELKAARILSWERGFRNQYMETGVSNRYQLNPVAMKRIIESGLSDQSVIPDKSGLTDLGSGLTESGSALTDLGSGLSDQSVPKEHIPRNIIEETVLEVGSLSKKEEEIAARGNVPKTPDTLFRNPLPVAGTPSPTSILNNTEMPEAVAELSELWAERERRGHIGMTTPKGQEIAQRIAFLERQCAAQGSNSPAASADSGLHVQ